MNEQKVRLGGLWKKQSKTGTAYLTGRLGQARLLIFKNNERGGKNSPEYTMYLAPDERQPEGAGG